jgi:hypothetical protein
MNVNSATLALIGRTCPDLRELDLTVPTPSPITTVSSTARMLITVGAGLQEGPERGTLHVGGTGGASSPSIR